MAKNKVGNINVSTEKTKTIYVFEINNQQSCLKSSVMLNTYMDKEELQNHKKLVMSVILILIASMVAIAFGLVIFTTYSTKDEDDTW
jgi:hypothetical protein